MRIKNPLLFSAMCLGVLWSARAQTTFTQITNGPIANEIGPLVGACWGDFHNTGWLDLLVSGYNGTNVFYQNNGGGTFTRITGNDPVLDLDYHTVPAAADFDNDGSLDLLVPSGVFAPAARHCLLYHNNGDGSFSRVSGGVVTNLSGFFGDSSWVDYDNDGFVDLFIGDSGTSTASGGKNLLFHNNGDGTFSQITTGAIVNDLGACNGSLWADYDNDGFMDLVVLNGATSYVHSFIYHNNGNGTFTRILTNTLATDTWPAAAESGAWGDYDNDGLPDLFVAGQNGINRLYHNQGSGNFTNVTSGPMLHPPGTTQSDGCAWGDYDNDGYLDLFVLSPPVTNGLYHNNGDGTFTQILSEPLVTNATTIHGAVAWVDYDNDGFLDLFFERTGAGNIHSNRVYLYHNNGNANAWLEVKLVGTVANRSAIGAKVRVHATIGGKTFWQLREITTSGSWGCTTLTAHFGLGDATNVETLRIEWPSGTVQELQNVPAKQILTITEPPRLLAFTSNGVPQFFLKAWPGMQFDIQSSSNLTAAWKPIGALTVINVNGLAAITDTNPPAADARLYRAVSQ